MLLCCLLPPDFRKHFPLCYYNTAGLLLGRIQIAWPRFSSDNPVSYYSITKKVYFIVFVCAARACVTIRQ